VRRRSVSQAAVDGGCGEGEGVSKLAIKIKEKIVDLEKESAKMG